MRQYFIHIDNEQKGPFTIDDLKSQQLKRDTPIWFEGLEDWKTSGEIEELRNLFISTPPPFASKQTPPPITNIPKQEKVVEQPILLQSKSDFSKPVPKSNTGKTILFIGLGVVLFLVIIVLTKQAQHQSYQQTIETNKNNEDEIKASIRNNIMSYVTAERSAYNYSTLGGISNLSMTVTNGTNYLIDKVQVKVIYIKANGEIWDTKIIDFDLLQPHTKKTIRIEDTNRGTSVQYEISSIHSTDLGL